MVHINTVHAILLGLSLVGLGFLIGLFFGRWQQRADDKLAREVQGWVDYYQRHPDELEKR